jgi:hypothetical protein
MPGRNLESAAPRLPRPREVGARETEGRGRHPGLEHDDQADPILARALFAEERAEYLASIDRETKQELLAVGLEELQRQLCRSLAGRQHCRCMGLASRLAPVFTALLYAQSRDVRLWAASLTVRTLERAARRAA